MMQKGVRLFLGWAVGCLLVVSLAWPIFAQANTRFEVTFPASLRAEPVTGRLIIVIARKESPEPRLTISPYGSLIFGADVEQLYPDAAAIIDEQTLGYPLSSLKEVPAGDYYVQAVMNVYTECHRSDGHTVWVHLDRSQGLPLNVSPGNLYSEAQKVHLGPNAALVAKLRLDKIIPAAESPSDTEWLKHIKIQSQLLTKPGRPSTARLGRRDIPRRFGISSAARLTARWPTPCAITAMTFANMRAGIGQF